MVTNPSVLFKHAFVTGATGIVGSQLCEMVAQMGIPVTSYSRSSNAFSGSLGITHKSGDILDVENLRIAAKNADVIFHLAAAVHNSATSYDEYKCVNVKGTENVIQVAKEIDAKIIHVSTVNVDGFLKGKLSHDYAKTKAEAEDVIHLAVRAGLDAVIIRLATVFGNQPGRSGLIVDRLFSGSLNVLPAPLRKISPVWTHDLVWALIKAAEVGEKGRVYTIAGPTITTVGFVESISQAAGISPFFLSVPVSVIWLPLKIAWWIKGITRWIPPITVESLKSDSIHDGRQASHELGFSYTPLSEIFSTSQIEL